MRAKLSASPTTRRSVIPYHATPYLTTPHHTTPRHATPRHATPHHTHIVVVQAKSLSTRQRVYLSRIVVAVATKDRNGILELAKESPFRTKYNDPDAMVSARWTGGILLAQSQRIPPAPIRPNQSHSTSIHLALHPALHPPFSGEVYKCGLGGRAG